MPRQLLACLLMMAFSASLHAKDLGVVGTIVTPIELDMLDWIHQRLQHMQRDGEWEAIRERAQAEVKARLERPRPVQGLTTTTTPRVYFIDPTMTLQRDITDAKGHVIYPAGLSINPFDPKTWPHGAGLPAIVLNEQLMFLDGDDARQVAWAKQQLRLAEASHRRTKVVLVNGSPNQVAKALHRHIYFDQTGHYCQRFAIQHVPVLIQQDHTQWKVTEFDVHRFSVR